MEITPEQRAAMFKRASLILAQSPLWHLVIVVGAGVSVASANAPGWAALVRNFCDFAENEVPRVSRNSIDSLRRKMDQQMLVQAADTLRKDLTSGEFGLFLKDQFEKLRSSKIDPALYSMLGILRSAGARLATTNYDTLIEDNLGLPRADWTDEDLHGFFTSAYRPVLHVHGMWRKPNDIVFSSDDYAAIADPQLAKPGRKEAVKRLQFWFKRAFAYSNVLFVGCGETISDPHFTHLFDLADNLQYGADKRHVCLCTDEVYEALAGTVHDSVMLLPYGLDSNQIGPAVRRVFPQLFDPTVGPHSGLADDLPEMQVAANLNDANDRPSET